GRGARPPNYPGRSRAARSAGESPRARAGLSRRPTFGVTSNRAKSKLPKMSRVPPPAAPLAAAETNPGIGSRGRPGVGAALLRLVLPAARFGVGGPNGIGPAAAAWPGAPYERC